MFSGTNEVEGYGDHQQYFVVIKKILPAEFIGEALSAYIHCTDLC
jgi:hypothetical protein